MRAKHGGFAHLTAVAVMALLPLSFVTISALPMKTLNDPVASSAHNAYPATPYGPGSGTGVRAQSSRKSWNLDAGTMKQFQDRLKEKVTNGVQQRNLRFDVVAVIPSELEDLIRKMGSDLERPDMQARIYKIESSQSLLNPLVYYWVQSTGKLQLVDIGRLYDEFYATHVERLVTILHADDANKPKTHEAVSEALVQLKALETYWLARSEVLQSYQVIIKGYYSAKPEEGLRSDFDLFTHAKIALWVRTGGLERLIDQTKAGMLPTQSR